MPKLKNQPNYVTILQLSQDYHKKVERLVKTVSSSGHLYSANQIKELFQDLKSGITMILYFNFRVREAVQCHRITSEARLVTCG